MRNLYKKILDALPIKMQDLFYWRKKQVYLFYNFLCNNILYFFLFRPTKNLPALKSQPRRICLESSPVCQLRCPSCPTTKGVTRRGSIGASMLTFADFKKLVDKNPWIESIELSNWGEIFLNPHILDIIKYGYEKNIVLTAKNGTNFNQVKDEVLEGLVKYHFSALTCSIDGATQETYTRYRINGNIDQVITNIRRLMLLNGNIILLPQAFAGNLSYSNITSMS